MLIILLTIFVLWLKLLVAHRIKFLEYVDEHRFFCLDVSFICVSYKIHVDFSVSIFSFLIVCTMKWILFVKLVKIFIADLRCNLWNIWWSFLSHPIPIDAFKEWMGLDFLASISSKSCFGITNHSFEDIC